MVLFSLRFFRKLPDWVHHVGRSLRATAPAGCRWVHEPRTAVVAVRGSAPSPVERPAAASRSDAAATGVRSGGLVSDRVGRYCSQNATTVSCSALTPGNPR